MTTAAVSSGGDISFKSELIMKEVNYHVELYSENNLDMVDEINIKEEFNSSNVNATPDENMAVEALRQLGGMFENNIPNSDINIVLCEMCGESFTSITDLQSHTILCTGWENYLYKCKLCSASFQKKVDLNNHIVCHRSERPYSCKLCGNLFIDNHELQVHCKTVHTEIKCSGPAVTVVHNEVNSCNKCEVCAQEFQRASSLTNHMKIHTYLPGRALQQFQHVLNKNELHNLFLDTNLNINDVLKEEEVDGRLEIPDIAAEDVNLTNKTCGNANEGTNNEEFIFLPEQQEVHVENKLKPHRCTFCGVSFARQKALKSHLRLHTEYDVFECDVCRATFVDEAEFTKHTGLCKEKSEFSTSIPSHINIAKLLPLPLLESSSMNNNKEQTAFKQPIGELYKKHVCEICSKRFATRQKLDRHKQIHEKKTFMCEVCSVIFQERAELDEHRLANHPAVSGYICDQCGKGFSSRQGLWEHSKIHDGTKMRMYVCTECDKAYSSRQGYLIHKRTHTGERPYGCRWCMKSFRDGGTLRKHEEIHTGRRHVCAICFKRFTQKVVLRDHVRNIHYKLAVPNKDGLFGCTLCGHCFSNKEELFAHIVMHSSKTKKQNLESGLMQPNSQLQNQPLDQEQQVLGVGMDTLTMSVMKNEKLIVVEPLAAIAMSNDAENLDIPATLVATADETIKAIRCGICNLTFEVQEELLNHIQVHV